MLSSSPEVFDVACLAVEAQKAYDAAESSADSILLLDVLV